MSLSFSQQQFTKFLIIFAGMSFEMHAFFERGYLTALRMPSLDIGRSKNVSVP